MDQLGNRIKNITTELKGYMETRFELLLLNFSDKTTLMVGELIRKMMGYSIVGVGLIFALIAAAIYLGDVLGHPSFGYLAVAGFLLLVGLIFIMVKPKGVVRSIQQQLMAEIIDSLDEKNKKEDQKPLLQNKETEIDKHG